VQPDGKRVFVSNGKDATVSVIDTARNEIVATVPVGKRPWNMAVTPDGKKLYVANGKSNSVSVIDTETNQSLKQIPVGDTPWGVVIR
jgi:YVTN family beta-propeller protein